MTLSARPVPVAAFQANYDLIVAILDDGSVWWVNAQELRLCETMATWHEAPSIPNTIQAVYQGQRSKK